MYLAGFNATNLGFLCSSLLISLFLFINFDNIQHVLETNSHVRTTRLLKTTTSEETEKPTIPHKLYFDSYRFPGISDNIQDKYKENVQNTMNKYKKAWNIDTIETEVLNTEKCKDSISKIPIKDASTDLLKYFMEKDTNRHVCRIAVLFLYGGYFLQEELEVIEPWLPSNDDVSFVAVTSTEGLFNGPFLVSSQYHPLLYRALKKYILFAKGELKLQTESRFGEIMRSAYREVTAVNPDYKSDMMLLTEENLGVLQEQHNDYKQVQKQDGEGRFCNYAIVDYAMKKTYFFSRFPGAHGHLCDEAASITAQSPKAMAPESSKAVINAPQEVPTIPHTLWFASRHELSSLQKENIKHYNNILKTVKAYKLAWGTDNVEYKILDNKACMNAIVKLPITGASSALFEFYLKEFKDHPSKGFDICRAAVLFQTGGYFFNEELEVIEPYTSKNNDITFVGVKSQSSIFLPSFVASTAEHPVMQEVITKFIMLALKKIKLSTTLSGGEIYRDAYNSQDKNTMSKSVLLLEKHMTVLDNEYDKKPVRSHKCSYVIYSPESKKIHFYTRMFIDGEYCADESGNKLL